MSVNYEGAYKLVYEQLEHLDKRLYYHGRHHTFQDVLPNSELLARESNLSEEETLIVKTAALFHDTGFLDQYDKNEPFGCERAQKYLPTFGYSEEQIAQICECIMATQLPQSPKNLLSQIVCDADLGHLGTDLYFLRSESLFVELKRVKNLASTSKKWHMSNIEFLKKHSYFSEAAKRLFHEGKMQNMREEMELLGIESTSDI